MTLRVLLFTGKGGVGKTTAAAATAAAAARRGQKVLVLSTDGAHSLGDALATPLGSEPTEVETGLYALHVDAQRGFERAWRDVQQWLVAWLERAGVDPLEAEELTVLPGAEEVLALLAVRDHVASGQWDLVVVDCAPTAETLRLLALPEALGWYVRRIMPVERRVMSRVRPLLARATTAPMPTDRLYDAIDRLHRELGEVREVLADPHTTSVRLVLTPEAVVLAEARRTLTTLSLHGYRVDGVVANRVFPADGADAWRAGWVMAQRARLEEVHASFDPLPVLVASYTASEPVGVQALAAFGDALYGDGDPVRIDGDGGAAEELVHVERTVDGFALTIALPLAERSDVDLVRRGEELVVTVGGHRRVLVLPSALRRCEVEGAALRDGRLVVRFVPDPNQWPDVLKQEGKGRA
ncbi:MAG TPA: ArsA family ATPase [Mycobacteriales bacterium]|nr:ArsA family ATPase [Mycobacteriales bacterium]